MLLIFLSSYIISYLSKQPYVFVTPISIFLIVIWLYLFGVIGALELGAKIVFPIVIAIFIFFSFKVAGFIDWAKLKNLISPASVFFVLASAFTFIHSQHMRFKEWDEFSHWGPAVKSMFIFNKLGPQSPAELVFPDYPPGISLFSYFITQLGTNWDEADVYWSYQLIAISIICAIVSKINWRQSQLSILALLLGILATIFYFNSLQTIYADPILGITFGYSLILATYKSSKLNLFLFLTAISALSLFKDAGIIFAFVSILVFLANNSNWRSKISAKFKILDIFIKFILLMSPLILLKIIWSIFLYLNNVTPGRNLTNVLIALVTGDFSSLVKPYWGDVTRAFVDKTVHQPLTQINGLQISTLNWLIILTLFYVFNLKTIPSRIEKIRELKNDLIIVFGCLFYLSFLLFLYLTMFTEGEARGLASFERYVSTYFAGMVIYFTSKIVNKITNLQDLKSQIPNSNSTLLFEKSIVVWVIFLLIQGSPGNLIGYLTNPNGGSDQIQNKYRFENDLISQMNLSSNDKVWIIAQHTVGFEFYMFQYQLLPASVGRSPWSIGSFYGPGDIWTDSSITPAIWENKLENFDFVFVYSVTDSFKNEFGRLFENGEIRNVPAFYKVTQNVNGIKLIEVK